MKKWISILCMLCILTGMLSSCGDDATSNADKTLLTAATELANELDRVPTIAEVIGATRQSVSFGQIGSLSAKSDDASTGTIVPLRDSGGENSTYYPQDPSEQPESDQSDPNFMTFGKFYTGIDATIANLKIIKNQALSACKTFSTWITYYTEQVSGNLSTLPGHGVYRDYRLQYDVNRDVVVIEQRYPASNGDQYYNRLSVSYTPDGKLQMQGILVTFNDTEIVNANQLYYLEDHSYVSVSFPEQHKSEKLTVYDLQNNEWATACISAIGAWDVAGNPVGEIVYQFDKDYYISTDYFSYELRQNSGTILSADNNIVGGWNISEPSVSFSFSLNCLDGWSSVTCERDERAVLKTEKGEFVFPYSGVNPGEVTPDGNCKYDVNYHGSTSEPVIELNQIVHQEEGATATAWTAEEALQAIRDVAADLGLTVKEDMISEVIGVIYGYAEHDERFCFGDEIYGKDLTENTFYSLTSMLMTEQITAEAMNQLASEPAIAFEEQTAHYEYFEFLDYSIDGAASVDQATHEISLTKITATLAPSILLKEDGDYSLVFVWASASEHQEVGHVDLHYSGETLCFESDLVISPDRFPNKYGEYVLTAYLADADGNRISTLRAVTATDEFTLELTGENYEATLTSSANGISIRNKTLPSIGYDMDSIGSKHD